MRTEARGIKKALGWSIALGVIFIVLGVLAIAFPVVSTIAITITLAWLFLLGGIVRFVYAFQTRDGRGFWSKLILGILQIILGILLLTNIAAGILSLTLILGIAIFLEGVFEVILAFQLRREAAWGWVLFSGIVTIILGILIWSQWPFNAPWVIGLLAGLSFLFTGIWILMMSLAARRSVGELTS